MSQLDTIVIVSFVGTGERVQDHGDERSNMVSITIDNGESIGNSRNDKNLCRPRPTLADRRNGHY